MHKDRTDEEAWRMLAGAVEPSFGAASSEEVKERLYTEVYIASLDMWVDGVHWKQKYPTEFGQVARRWKRCAIGRSIRMQVDEPGC